MRSTLRIGVGSAVALVTVLALAVRLQAGGAGTGRRGDAYITAPDRNGHGGSPVHATLPAGGALDTAVFAGGCFWGIEAVFDHVKGVQDAVSGYAGGQTRSPSYEQVSSGDTGHAESVRVVFDPSVVSYGTLLRVFFSVHDPTQLDRQGPDVGTQYRSAIFFRTAEQQRQATTYVDFLTRQHAFPRPIVTQVAPLRAFYPAEDYHQDYMAHHPTQPYIVINDAPKLEHLRTAFAELYRE